MYADKLQQDTETVMSVREMLVRAPLCSEALHEAQQSASGLVCAELEWLHKEL